MVALISRGLAATGALALGIAAAPPVTAAQALPDYSDMIECGASHALMVALTEETPEHRAWQESGARWIFIALDNAGERDAQSEMIEQVMAITQEAPTQDEAGLLSALSPRITRCQAFADALGDDYAGIDVSAFL